MRILYLDLDTLRPDHLGCYGYGRRTSPNINRIAADGVRFDNYFCSDAPCLPSRAALTTGRFGFHTGLVGHGGTAADLRLEGPSRGFRDLCGRANLPMVFRRAGLHTASISPFAERHSAWWFYAGFREILNTGKGGMESAEDVTPTVLDWIARNAARDDWFLHVNFWDPHTPYRAPADFGDPFQDEPLPAWLTPEVLAGHLGHVGPHSAHEIGMYDSQESPLYPRQPGEIHDSAGLRRLIDGYDCGIRYLDDHLGRVFEAFARQGVMDDLAVVISSDHGENLGELGIYAEHATADRATCRIPMIVRWPGLKRGHVDRGLHLNLDLAPTLAELLGQEPDPSWDGRSYAAALVQGADCGRESAVISQCAHVCQRGVRFGAWLYVRTYHDGYHLFPDELLFNVEQDPHEQNDLAAARPALVREGAYRLAQWQEEMLAAEPGRIDPLRTVLSEGGPLHARGALPRYCERLRATGRGHAVAELRRRHPGEFEQARRW